MPEPTVSPQAKLAAKEVLRNLNDRRGIRQALDEGEGEYDVYGDGDFLRSFDDLSDAIDYANNNSGDYRELTVEDSDGDVVENIEGDLTPAYTVYADGTNMGEFDALADAKAEAIRLFATDDYSEVSVEDDDGDDVVSLSN